MVEQTTAVFRSANILQLVALYPCDKKGYKQASTHYDCKVVQNVKQYS